jgi:hypothetical protein
MASKSYPVQKDGVNFEVRASSPEEARAKAESTDIATVPRVIARNGSTRVFERPNGQRYVVSPGASFTDPKKVEQVLAGMTAGEVTRQGIDEQLIAQTPMAARAGEFVRGVPFVGSRADELVGAIAGPEAATGMRALSGAMQRQRPGETLALNLGGGLAGTAAAALAAPQAATGLISSTVGTGSRGAQIARGAAAGTTAGGIEGLIYGSGEGTNAQERRAEAGRGAAIGATGGAAFGAAAPVVSEVAGNVIGLFRRSDINQIAREFGISTNAAKVIKNTFDQGGDVQAAIANLNRAGGEAMLADAGPAAQALLDATAASGGTAGQIVRGAVDERMARTNRAVTSSLDSALGTPPLGPQTALDEIAARSAPARQEAYNLAYNTPIDYASPQGRQIEEVLGRIEPEDVMRGIREANAEMRSLGMTNQQIMATIGPDGQVVYQEMPNVRQLDELKKALQGIAYSSENTNQFGRLTGTGKRYNRLAGELRDAVSDAVEPYGAAVSIGGDKLAEERAFMLGRDLLKAGTEVEDVVIELGSRPSQDQVAAAKSGLRSYIEKAMGDIRAIASDPSADAQEARQVIKAVTDMSSDNARRKIRDLMGAEADALLAQIDEAAQSATVRAAMAQNSKTAGRQATMGTVDEITAPGVVGQAMQGEAVNTTKAMIQAVTGQTAEYTAAQRQRIYQDIARALTEKSGENAVTSLRVLDAAMKGQALTDTQTDQLAKMLAGVLFGGATAGTTRGAAAERRQDQ